MAVIYSVGITSGIPSSGTGSVATINEFLSTPGTPNSTSCITVQPVAVTYATITAASGNNATSVKGTGGVLYGAHLYNNAATPVYFKLYNSSIAPTVGTTPAFCIGVSPGAARDVRFTGMISSLGIGYAMTLGITSTSTTAVAANDILGILEYL